MGDIELRRKASALLDEEGAGARNVDYVLPSMMPKFIFSSFLAII